MQLNYIINNSANNNNWMKIAEILIVLKSAPAVVGVVGPCVGGLIVAVSLDLRALITEIPNSLANRK